MCFISDLIEIAYQQDSAIPGYVQDDSVVMLADAIEAAIVAADELVYDQPQPFKVEERFANSTMRKSFFFRINAIYTPEWVDIHPSWGVFLMDGYVVIEIPADTYMQAFSDYQCAVRELEAKGVSYSALTTEQKMTHLLHESEQIVLDDPFTGVPTVMTPITMEELNALCGVNEVPVGSYDHLWDRYGQVQLQPIQGPRELGKPLSTNLMYHYTWPDGHEVRTLRKIYR